MAAGHVSENTPFMKSSTVEPSEIYVDNWNDNS